MKIVKSILRSLYQKITFYLFIYNSLHKKNIIIDNTAKIYFNKENLDISNDVVIGAYSVLYAIDSKHSNKKGILKIGQNTSIGEFNNIRAAGGKITIGNNCLISQFVTIVASNHNTIKGKNINDQGWNESKTDVWIGDDVWIGANCVILPGVKISNGSIIAAGSVVTKNVIDNSIAMGIPAKIFKER
jgi:acetyltransferase-like isoleucine patch superfamily enzyme